MKSLKIALLLILTLAPVFFTVNANSSAEANCSDYEFIFARGTGQKMNDKDFNAYKAEILKKLKGQKISFYELGTKAGGYPAIPLNFWTALGAYVSAGQSYKYGESVQTGSKELILHVDTETKKCKNKLFVLSGYSQGAQVIDEALKYINSKKVLFVANFGDPKLYLPEGKRACENIGLSTYRIYAPDCMVEDGVLSGLKPYEQAGYHNKLGIWCNQNDFICGSSLNIFDPFKTHTAYDGDQGYPKFADLISARIAKNKATSKTEVESYEVEFHDPEPDDEVKTKYSEHKPMDIAIIVDYANSTLLPLNNYKVFSESIRSKLLDLNRQGVRMAIYFSYNVHRMAVPTKEISKFTTHANFEDDLNDLEFESAIKCHYSFALANNLYSSIARVSKKADWLDGHERNIYIYSNVNHPEGFSTDGTNRESALKIAQENHVKITAITDQEKPFDDFSDFNLTTDKAADSNTPDFSNLDKKDSPSKTVTKEIKKSQKIVRNPKNYFSKSFKINQTSPYTLVIINDAVYGISRNQNITITDLDKRADNKISLISYDDSGRKVKTEKFEYPSEKITPPETGTFKL